MDLFSGDFLYFGGKGTTTRPTIRISLHEMTLVYIEIQRQARIVCFF